MEYGGELFGIQSNLPYTGGEHALPVDWALYRSGRDALKAFGELLDV